MFLDHMTIKCKPNTSSDAQIAIWSNSEKTTTYVILAEIKNAYSFINNSVIFQGNFDHT